MLSQRITQLLPSATIAVDMKAKEFINKGKRVINLTIGEPDFDTPNNIRKAGIKAIDEGFTHYTQTAGILELKQAIAQKFKKENNLSYDTTEVIVGAGSKMLLYCLFQSICDEGDEVIVPVPTWSTYVEQIKLAGASPVLIKLLPPFKLTAREVGKKITAKTKAVLLNSPSNPTGAMIDADQLEQIEKLAEKYNLLIISDEIYEKIVYGKRNISIASLNKEIKRRTIVVNGFSKAYAMTGWRIGYAAGPKEIITAMTNLQGQTTFNPCSISQKAAIEALVGTQETVVQMVKEFSKRRQILIEKLGEIPQLGIIEPEGAFYFFISVERLLGKKYASSIQWCEALLEEEHVAVIPGEAFLYPGYFRLSYAAPITTLVEAAEKIARFVQYE